MSDDELLDGIKQADDIPQAFIDFIEANHPAEFDPLSDDAVKMQAQYIAKVGVHPFEILKTIVANPLVKSSDRINAAKTLLEYGMRKAPSAIEITGAKGAPLQVELANAADLRALVRGG